MCKQQELDFGEIINHPTPMSEVMIRQERPHWHTPEVEEFVYAELAKLVLEEDEVVEDIVEEYRDVFDKFNDFNNSYEVFRFLKNRIGCEEEWMYDLKDDIEWFSLRVSGFLDRKVEEWVNFWNIIPPVKVGDKVKLSRFSKEIFPKAKPEDYLIVKVRKNEAKVVAHPLDGTSKYTEEEALERKAGRLFTYEEILRWM